MRNINEIDEKTSASSLEDLTDEQLIDLKKQAIEDEDYDKAKQIKQEQERRKNLLLKQMNEDEKSQRESRLLELNKKLEQPKNNENITEVVDLSDEELEIVEDLINRMDKINSQYDNTSNLGEELIGFKSLNDAEKNKYFESHEIKSKVDFQKHVFNLCLEYLRLHFEYMKSDGIRVDLDDITDAIKSLDEYSDFLNLNSSDSDSNLYDLYHELDDTLHEIKHRVQDYLEL